MYNQIIVCEGTHDMIKIQSVYPNIMCIVTNGSEISKETLDMISKLSLNHEIICFLDPDYPGERIRSKILQIVPNALNVYISKNLCISNNHKKVGVEHASKEDIKKVLDPILNLTKHESSYIFTINDLYELNIVGNKKLREYIANVLNIGVPNNKTLIKRLNMLNITKEELLRIVGDYSA
ncbi:MAG: ribonuclease M5 [Anaeroplasmataceae bacterium]